jgi:hypothetical protein
MVCSPARNGRRARPLNSIVRLHVKAPALRLTDAARNELLSAMSQVSEPNLIAAVVWVDRATYSHRGANGTEQLGERGPHWGVGFYSSDQVPTEEVAQIDGIRFTFDPNSFARLNNAILDIVEGQWIVDERAI